VGFREKVCGACHQVGMPPPSLIPGGPGVKGRRADEMGGDFEDLCGSCAASPELAFDRPPRRPTIFVRRLFGLIVQGGQGETRV